MTTHTTTGLRVVALVASTGLVVASAGFGAVYAHSIGSQHGKILAGLTILFAVALELVKPLAIHGAFVALGHWRTFLKGLALGVLGLVAVAYSLTAELSLTASSRGDLTAKREQASEASVRALETHQRAKAELATLKPSRPLAELEGIVGATREVCRVYVSHGRRQTVCSKPRSLVAEYGRAKRRAELEAVLADSEDALASTPAIKSADPGSTALASYLATAGIVVAVEKIGQWLILVPVLALELGSALAMVLVSIVSPPRREPHVVQANHSPEPQATATVLEPVEAKPALLLPDHSKHRQAVAKMIVSHLQNHGGTIRGNERQLARDLGTTKPTLRRTLQSLADAGRLAATATKKGTLLQLL